MCVSVDTYNKVGRSKLDTRGQLCMLLGYSTQHAGDVYQFLHMIMNHIIYSCNVQWLGKLWHEFYHIPDMHSADKYVDPFDDYTGDYIEEPSTEQEGEKNIQGTEQTLAVIKDTHEGEDEPIGTRT